MKEINLGRILIENRHKRGITQEELASYLGVSKAAVSKWETETTYPDITLLPQLAAYFLFHIGSLLVNHSMLAETQEKSEQILEEARELFLRVKYGTDNPTLSKEALQMEAYCLLALRQPAEVLNLLDTDELEVGSTEPLLASAYQMTGNTTQAKRILQVGIYKEMLSLYDLLVSYMTLSLDEPTKFEQICARFQTIADAFHLDSLHPGILLSCYLAAAQGWTTQGESEKALQFLEKYTNLATGDIYPLQLHGDSFFDLLDEWLKEVPILGNYLPREESVIRHSMTQALAENPAFTALTKERAFKTFFQKLSHPFC